MLLIFAVLVYALFLGALFFLYPMGHYKGANKKIAVSLYISAVIFLIGGVLLWYFATAVNHTDDKMYIVRILSVYVLSAQFVMLFNLLDKQGFWRDNDIRAKKNKLILEIIYYLVAGVCLMFAIENIIVAITCAAVVILVLLIRIIRYTIWFYQQSKDK